MPSRRSPSRAAECGTGGGCCEGTGGGSAALLPPAHATGARPRDDEAAKGWNVGDWREEGAVRDAPAASGGRSDENPPPPSWAQWRKL